MREIELRQEVFKYTEKDDHSKDDVPMSRKSISIPVILWDRDIHLNTQLRRWFKVDTGASSTILPAKSLGIKLTEQEYKEKYNATPKAHVGIAKNVKIMYYTHYVDKMCIGKIKLTHVPVEITFNSNGRSKLLGMNILGLFDISISSMYKLITFTETLELAEYTHNNKPIGDPLNLCRDKYINLEQLDDGSSTHQELINSLLKESEVNLGLKLHSASIKKVAH